MAGYLNTSYYGRGAYGIQAAARAYYGKDAKELNPSQCAFLAALLKGADATTTRRAARTSTRSATPSRTPSGPRSAGRWILDGEVKDGRLTPAERAKYTQVPEARAAEEERPAGAARSATWSTWPSSYVARQHQASPTKQLDQGGYQIHTTFDKKKVDAAEARRSRRSTKENIDPKKRAEDRTSTSSSAAPRWIPKTGAIVAIYGGQDATKHFTNNADHDRCPGRLDLQAVRAGRRDDRRRPRIRTGRRTRHDDERTKVSPTERLQRQEQAEDHELQRHDLDGQERQGVAARPTTATSRHGPNDHPASGDATCPLNSPYVQLGHGRRHRQGAGRGHARRASRTTQLADYAASRRSPSAPPRPARSGWPARTRPSRPAASSATRTRSSRSTSKGGEVYKHKDVKTKQRLRRRTSRTTSPTC